MSEVFVRPLQPVSLVWPRWPAGGARSGHHRAGRHRNGRRKGGTGMRYPTSCRAMLVRCLLAGVAALALASTAAPALADHGGGGGGGGGVPPSAPAVTFTPASLTFAAQAIGTTSAAQPVTITNSGTASLFINGLAIGGAGPPDFHHDGAGAGPAPAPRTRCSVAVGFHPTAPGARAA